MRLFLNKWCKVCDVLFMRILILLWAHSQKAIIEIKRLKNSSFCNNKFRSSYTLDKEMFSMFGFLWTNLKKTKMMSWCWAVSINLIEFLWKQFTKMPGHCFVYVNELINDRVYQQQHLSKTFYDLTRLKQWR